MRLILVRPGDKHSHEQGADQAEFITRELESVVRRTLPVEAIYTSTNAVAAGTARIISERLGIALPIQEYAFEVRIADSAPDDLEGLQSQAWAAVESLQERHTPDCTLILVAEEMAIRLLVCRAVSISLSEMQRFRIDPASMTTLDFRLQPQRRTILAGLNETCDTE